MRKTNEIRTPGNEILESSVSTTHILSVTFEHLTEAVAVLDKERIVMCNSAFKYLFGYSKVDELKNFSILNFIPPAQFGNYLTKLKSTTQNELFALGHECHGIRKDSSLTDVEISIKTDSSSGKEITILSVKDITEKKHIQDQINKLSRVVDQSSSIIIITDPEGRVEYTNPKFSEVTGYFFEEVYGKRINIVGEDDASESRQTELWNRIYNGRDWRGEFRNYKKNGELYWESAVVTPIKNENGDMSHILVIKEDITSKKEMELELKRALDSAEEASKLKSNLLSNMSHELRTPMTGIIGFSSLLRDELQDSDHVEIIDKILKSSKRLLLTLNSILNLSEIESGTYPINLTEFNLGSYTKYFLTNYDKTAAEKNLDFNIQILDEEICAVGDENLFKQILMHIVDNALKFTYRGGVKVQITSDEDGSGNTMAIVKVIDSGIGIGTEDQNKIFREFRQLSEGIRRNFEGSGLGLSVAKKMAKLMKGDINVESELEKGSSFSIVLPGIKKSNDDSSLTIAYKPPLNSMPQNEARKNMISMMGKKLPNVLSIEDNLLNSELVNLFLRNICNVDTAHNYFQAIEKLKNKKYHALLIDINLGNGPSGIDIAKDIRSLYGYENTPLIAVTGYALLKDEKILLDEGFNYYLIKPYDREDLINILVKAINK
ncbi:MAG: PAS domain S-box protein [Bacteroidota bacterium]